VSPNFPNTLAIPDNLKSTEFVNRSCHSFVQHHISKLDYKELVWGNMGERSHKLFHIILEAAWQNTNQSKEKP
jgi:hypothetical protein